jgi:hypothetical protein
MGDAPAMAEAICRICADPVLAGKMGSRGRQRVADHFTIEQTARKVELVYANILGKRSLPPVNRTSISMPSRGSKRPEAYTLRP